MRVILLRHAEVIEEFQGKYNGHNDIALSAQGKADAKKLSSVCKDLKFDSVYCSDLLRTRETLHALDIKCKPIFTSELREKSWGKHEGMSFNEIQESGIKYKNFMQWIDALDGESSQAFIRRIKRFFFDVLQTSQDEKVLVVTHSGVIKTLLHLTQNISLEEAFSQKVEYGDFIELTL